MALTYLNTAACGLIAPEIQEAGNALYREFAHSASARSEAWRMHDEPRIRQTLADFVGTQPINTTVIPNFSWGMNGVVQSVKGKVQRVLLYKHDYPSLIEPFVINGFAITWVDSADGFAIDMDAVHKATSTHAVDMVALSHVQWNSGYKADITAIGALCKEHGVLFLVDATQSMGACAINFAETNADVLATSIYKWMNAGFGAGIMYMTDEFVQQYPPVVGGHNSYKMVGEEWKYVASVQSYEPGGLNMYGLMILEAAINHKNKLGKQFIERHNMQLTQLLLSALRDCPVQIKGDHTLTNRTSIVCMMDENGLGDHLKQNGIVVTQRNGILRASMHYYNTEADVRAMADCIRKFCNK